MSLADHIGDYEDFLMSTWIALFCFGLLFICGIAMRFLLAHSTSRPSFGLPAKHGLIMTWRFGVICIIFEIVIGYLALLFQYVAKEYSARIWAPNGFVNSQNDPIYPIIVFVTVCMILNRFMPSTVKRKYLGVQFAGNEKILFSGCKEGKSMIEIARQLNNEGRIYVHDPFNTVECPYNPEIASQNASHYGIESSDVSYTTKRLPEMTGKIGFSTSGGDLRDIWMPSESIDIAILNFVSCYPDEDTDIIASELHRIIKPEGRVVISSLTGSSIGSELKRIGFKRVKFAWRPYLPWGAFVSVYERDTSNDKLSLLESRPLNATFKPFTSIMRVETVPTIFLIVNLLCVLLSLMVTFGFFYLIYYFWEPLDVPVVLSSGTRVPAGMICPTVIWTFWGIVEASFMTHTNCRYGLFKTPKEVASSYMTTSTSYFFINAIFQGVFWLPQFLADLYLSKWIPESVTNNVSFVLLMVLMAIGWFVYCWASVKYARGKRSNALSEDTSLLGSVQK